jgi:hypothetical protein
MLGFDISLIDIWCDDELLLLEEEVYQKLSLRI